MRLLLDTHLLLWALSQPAKLPRGCKSQLEGADVYVSAASIWEISIKTALGKLKADPTLVLEACEPAGFSLLPITGEHSAAVYALPPLHRDPFDRLLIAQARLEQMSLVTNDKALAAYGRDVSVL